MRFTEIFNGVGGEGIGGVRWLSSVKHERIGTIMVAPAAEPDLISKTALPIKRKSRKGHINDPISVLDTFPALGTFQKP